MLGTLADAYANSIMVDALILGREGTIVRPDTNYYAPSLPIPNDIDKAPPLERWEPWVRAHIAVGELLQGISYLKTTDGFQVSQSGSVIATIGRPSQTTFEKQIPKVLSWGELRNERATEILAQIDPQYAFWSSIVYMHPDRTKRTFELINLMLQLCVFVEMRFKHALACWRPVEYSAQVQPMITTPGHGAFPSGHATQAHAVAYLLKALLNLNAYPTVTAQLDRQAARIATNRVVAGVHFPVDSMAGRMLGVALAEYFIGRCLGSTASKSRTFNATHMDNHPRTDFNPFNADQGLAANKFYSESTGGAITQSLLMKHLWDAAKNEWLNKFP